MADSHTAIVTSGNLTRGSLYRNYEYGVHISDPAMVHRIAEDLHEYSLGAIDEINDLARVAATLRDQHNGTLESARPDLRQQFENQLENTLESLMELLLFSSGR